MEWRTSATNCRCIAVSRLAQALWMSSKPSNSRCANVVLCPRLSHDLACPESDTACPIASSAASFSDCDTVEFVGLSGTPPFSTPIKPWGSTPPAGTIFSLSQGVSQAFRSGFGALAMVWPCGGIWGARPPPPHAFFQAQAPRGPSTPINPRRRYTWRITRGICRRLCRSR